MIVKLKKASKFLAEKKKFKKRNYVAMPVFDEKFTPTKQNEMQTKIFTNIKAQKCKH